MFTLQSKVVWWPSAVSGDIVQSVDQKICERRRYPILELSCECSQILRTVLCGLIAVMLCYHKS
jgi:hypothetical protein